MSLNCLMLSLWGWMAYIWYKAAKIIFFSKYQYFKCFGKIVYSRHLVIWSFGFQRIINFGLSDSFFFISYSVFVTYFMWHRNLVSHKLFSELLEFDILIMIPRAKGYFSVAEVLWLHIYHAKNSGGIWAHLRGTSNSKKY